MSNKNTFPILTKYERTKIIGKRALQLSQGSEPQIDIGNMTNALQIAIEEFNQKKIPFIFERVYPDGTKQEFKLSDF